VKILKLKNPLKADCLSYENTDANGRNLTASSATTTITFQIKPENTMPSKNN